MLCAAGVATIRYLREHHLIQRCADMGRVLHARLATLRAHALVGDVRGRGLLAGVELVADRESREALPRSAAAAELRLRELGRQPDTGVLLVEERLHEALPVELRRRLARRPLPMVVPFPGPAWAERPEGAEAYVIELLRQVIGYRVRLR